MTDHQRDVEFANAWIKMDQPCPTIKAESDNVETAIWFKSEPLGRTFINRVAQIQLCTDSFSQDFVGDPSQGSWSWFDLVVLPGSTSETPKQTKDGSDMIWKSHSNQLGQSHAEKTRHFGNIFDRRSELLACLEPGDVIAIRVCARFRGWENHAHKGYVTTRVLDYDLILDNRWTLASEQIPELSESSITDGSYTFSSSTGSIVDSTDDTLHSKIWFKTPALSSDAINKLESLQLFTRSRFQRWDNRKNVPQEDSFSWFDIVILEKPDDTEPKKLHGVSMVWLSHANDENDFGPDPRAGQVFDENEANHEKQPRASEIKQIKGALEEGNLIAVRICAQYPGWQNWADSGRLVLRVSNESPAQQDLVVPNLDSAVAKAEELQQSIYEYYDSVAATSKGHFIAQSTSVNLLVDEIRADKVVQVTKIEAEAPPAYDTNRKPLRLLSLDGGGVRGVSELSILKQIMQKLPKIDNRDPHPHEVFDLIAGTSTGGLIAIMLGRLKMSIDECEEAYKTISKDIFGKKSGWFIKSSEAAFAAGSYVYDSEPLVKAVKDIVARRLPGIGADALLQDTNNTADTDECKATNSTDNGRLGVHLRSYKTTPKMQEEYPGFKIWEAARATSAAPTYFERLKVGDDEFIDGGMGYNNPVLELIAEATNLFGILRPIQCVITLGTGIPLDLKFRNGPKAIKDLFDLLTNSETANLTAGPISLGLQAAGQEKYWRFNLSKALSDRDFVVKTVVEKGWFKNTTKEVKVEYGDVMMLLDDWTAIPLIQELTDMWLKREPDAIEACAHALKGFEKK